MHSRLEQYLSEVSAHLGALPRKRRGEELREMRGHLEAAFAAGIGREQSEEETAREVLAQFGTPEELGTETVAAWRRGVSLDRRGFWGAAAFGLFLLLLLPHLTRPLNMAFLRQIGSSTPVLATVFAISWDVVECLLIGWGVGVLFPRRAVAAVGLAWSARIVWNLAFQILHLSHASAWSAYPLAYTPQQAVWCSFTALFCLLGAWAGSRWRMDRREVARG